MLLLIGQVVEVGTVNTAGVQPKAAPWAGDILDRIPEPCFVAAMGAYVSLGYPFRGLTPLSNRNTETNPVVIGLLAFLNRNIGLGCFALGSARSPYFIAFVSVSRFRYPLRAEVALEGISELVQLVALGRALADPYLAPARSRTASGARRAGSR